MTGVFVGVLVAVFVGVFVAVLVGVFVAVLVGVFVGVFVAVLIGVLVGVFVAVLVGAAETTRVPVAVAVPPWHPAPLPASTVKVVVPAGVPADVVRVSVEDASPPVLVTEEGLNVAVTPLGSAVVMLRGDVQEAVVPLKLTVIAYVAEPPAATGLGDCAPTVTLFGFASVNVPVTATAEVRPIAV